MMNKITIKIMILTIFIVMFNLKSFSASKIFITYKINNELITNIDIFNESKYLLALNDQLKNLSDKKVIKIATDSIIKESVKKIELLKYFKLNQKNPYINEVIKNFYLRLGLKNILEFEKYLSDYNLTIKDVKKKIEIETTWNQLIYEKYKNQVDIDIENIKKK